MSWKTNTGNQKNQQISIDRVSIKDFDLCQEKWVEIKPSAFQPKGLSFPLARIQAEGSACLPQAGINPEKVWKNHISRISIAPARKDGQIGEALGRNL